MDILGDQLLLLKRYVNSILVYMEDIKLKKEMSIATTVVKLKKY